MKYTILGGFNEGLKVLKSDKVIFFSKRKLIGLNKVELSIYDFQRKLICKFTSNNNPISLDLYIDNIKQSVEFKGRYGISYSANINFKNLIDCNLNIKYNKIPINRYINIYSNKNKVGYVNRKLFCFKKKYTLELFDKYLKFHNVVLLFMLIFETEFDHE